MAGRVSRDLDAAIRGTRRTSRLRDKGPSNATRQFPKMPPVPESDAFFVIAQVETDVVPSAIASNWDDAVWNTANVQVVSLCELVRRLPHAYPGKTLHNLDWRHWLAMDGKCRRLGSTAIGCKQEFLVEFG